MNNIDFESIFKFKPFDKISKDSRKILKENVNIISLNPGEIIIDKDASNDFIYILKSGSARVLGSNKSNKLVSFFKLSQGDIIGFTSYTYDSDEYVIAAGTLELFEININVWLKILTQEIKFKSEVFGKLYKQEFLHFILHFYNKSPKILNNFEKLVVDVYQESGVITPTVNEIKDKLNLGYKIYNISNFSYKSNLFEEITFSNLSNIQSTEKERLIYIKKEFIEFFEDENIKSNSTEKKEITKNNTLNSSLNNSPNKFKLLSGQDEISQDIATIMMLADLLEMAVRKDSIRSILEDFKNSNQKIDLTTYGKIISSIGLQVSISVFKKEDLLRISLPVLIIWEDSLRLIKETTQKSIIIASPTDGFVEIESNQIEKEYPNGVEYLIFNRINITPTDRFNLNWFLPVLNKYKSVLFQILISSFVIQLLTLANPLLIQVIIDKVISQRSLDTLQVLGIALLTLTIFEGFLISIKTFLFAETTNRIDQKLGSEVIDHLYRLPLEFFDRRAVGELGSRVDELEKIRNFITGQGLTTILDSFFSIIYIGIMLIYSVKLTIISLLVLPIQIILTIIGAPLFRRQYRETAQNNAKTKSHLVETLNGIQTIKAQNIETDSRWKWQDLYSKYIASSFKKTITSTAISQLSQVLQKISQLLVLWIGASMVLEGRLTLGQLIAFRIISSYVTQPILRLSTVWQTLQELNVSFERLGDIINIKKEKEETDNENISMPKISGLLKFDNVDFNFIKSNVNSLSNINLKIEPGTFVGLAGKSGSGKSTLTKLIPRLYKPSKGIVSIDNYDVTKVDLYSLRRQIGIVPQEALLFSGTILVNLRINNKNASDELIVKVTKRANAHDFIMKMPDGYNTQIGERGSSMSGGQRQRIAIARTLLSEPKMLILDEATSALDFESEKIIVDNLINSYRDLTVIFISHRLQTLENADLIIMMEDGKIAESGTHSELLENKGSYSYLYNQQGK